MIEGRPRNDGAFATEASKDVHTFAIDTLVSSDAFVNVCDVRKRLFSEHKTFTTTIFSFCN